MKYIVDTAMNVKGMISHDEVLFLANMAKETHGQIVEVGSYHGRSAIALCMGQATRMEKNPPVVCVDPFESYEAVSSVVSGVVYHGEQDYHQFANNVATYNIKHLRCDSTEAVKVFRDGEVALLFLDGQHDFEHVKSDFDAWLPKLRAHAVVIFHDNDEAGVKELLNLLGADRRWLEVGGARLMTALRWYPDAVESPHPFTPSPKGEGELKSKPTGKAKKNPTAVGHWSDKS